jgi:peptidyl-prolyl cis-trans isomerase B (cyclophilin B)
MLGCVVMSVSCGNSAEKSEPVNYIQFEEPAEGAPVAIIKTSMGDITVVLYPQYAPKAVENFTTHATDGYYDGVIFHRVINKFMLQGGDPEGTGMGGESIWGEPFEDEVVPELRQFRGALSMANGGANTNGSQFFIVQNSDIGEQLKQEFANAIKDPKYMASGYSYSPIRLAERFTVEAMNLYTEHGGSPHLDYPGLTGRSKHTVFGHVIEGMNVVDAIAAVEVDGEKPVVDVVINSIEITTYSK